MKTFYLYLLILICQMATLQAQPIPSYYNGLYQIVQVNHEGTDFILYQFSRQGGRLKARYFAQNANYFFQQWKAGKQVLLVCAGAFSSSWETDAPPVGICVDNGQVVNRAVNNTMDGLVVIYNGGSGKGGVAMTNLEKEAITVAQGLSAPTPLWVHNTTDRMMFLNWAERESATVFQTQLMYSKSHGFGFDLYNHRYAGALATRRFLATAQKGNELFHLVIDMPHQADYLNNAAYKVVGMLQQQGFGTIWGLINLDTGGKDILQVYDPYGNLLHSTDKGTEVATNLLVYYYE